MRITFTDFKFKTSSRGSSTFFYYFKSPLIQQQSYEAVLTELCLLFVNRYCFCFYYF